MVSLSSAVLFLVVRSSCCFRSPSPCLSSPSHVSSLCLSSSLLYNLGSQRSDVPLNSLHAIACACQGHKISLPPLPSFAPAKDLALPRVRPSVTWVRLLDPPLDLVVFHDMQADSRYLIGSCARTGYTGKTSECWSARGEKTRRKDSKDVLSARPVVRLGPGEDRVI